MSADCEICKRLKDKSRIIIYEDDNIIACLAKNQIVQGKTSVYYKKHVEKFTQLSEQERNSLMNSVIKVANLLEQSLKPDHMNYCLLGNYYKHIHWHLMPRYYDKNKDNFVFKTGLEPCHMGREVDGRYDITLDELKKLKDKIINQS